MNFHTLARIFLIAVATYLSAGCSIMPTNGPNSTDVRYSGQGSENSLPYALVRITPEIEAVLASYAPRLSNQNTQPFKRPPTEIRFGIGDVVSVTIFEAAAGGLFIPLEAGVRPGNFVTIPNQNVDSNGFITVPYAGQIRAKGRTPAEVQVEIVNALKNRAIEPQAVVALIDQRTSLISVLGEVNTPSRFPANAAGEHILDAITRAGGPKGQGFDTWVMLERGGRRTTIPFGQLVYEPQDNIFVQPNDTIYVYREPQNFIAFGASGAQGQFNFEAWRISLAEGVAKAGGLNDLMADPASVFLYRGETREVAERLGIDTARFPGPVVPVVYNVNFRDPSGYFLATKFQMRAKDVIYVSNAAAVEAAKIMQFIRLVTATVNDPVVAASNIKGLSSGATGASATTP
ncbi:polysaccharide export protein [Bradyrhizobium jicamae]|uniref:polysaccharide biosynthesis/export family protein n=1 Tax=Bradyrhizobium jicamae TaxID=280332 RepID=UPI001BADA627|nr:polysaccharide biosynthesis/export family protein [Bradyrhizobium jicamae]MBR0750769.1 polysaccharide export protein [Bradyrhizobium jicamae]